MIDASWLRRQVGVVLQENMLFNRSVRENIALSDPGMPMDRVVEAAKLAGAHEFILELPQGYDTLVGEKRHRALGRSAAAHCHREGAGDQSAPADLRRGDQCARL